MLPDAFGCSVANRFGNLLDDDADPFDLISEAETEKEKKRRQKKEEEEKKCKQKKSGQKETQKDRRVPVPVSVEDPIPVRKQGAHGILAESNSRGVQRGMRKAAVGQYRTTRIKRTTHQSLLSQSMLAHLICFVSRTWFNATYDTRSRGGTRAGRGQRGGGAGYNRNSENLNLRGKREYDRHSGTGVSPEEKRGGRGPWNWGSVEDTAGELMEVPEVTSNAPYKPEESQSPVDAQIQSPEETDTEMLVHVAMEMTLDEWKALQESSRPKAEFNLRKAESKIPSKARVIQSKRKEVKMLPDAFGCSVANRFGNLLDDDADPFDLISEAETEKEKKRRQKKRGGKEM
ncbi:intracellular hyaluronan-binding protein 4-like [Thalassophryne amazonica]|uniref:intracellular hyaluronan-binding protein 4-like n=1 Tax=Thalassophryne amazonica TaxID=390379 RepID=UPI00147213FC|nr:intracellular hyaluronan-binding protein 4-like [Thalassophryne amazonica]